MIVGDDRWVVYLYMTEVFDRTVCEARTEDNEARYLTHDERERCTRFAATLRGQLGLASVPRPRYLDRFSADGIAEHARDILR